MTTFFAGCNYILHPFLHHLSICLIYSNVVSVVSVVSSSYYIKNGFCIVKKSLAESNYTNYTTTPRRGAA